VAKSALEGGPPITAVSYIKDELAALKNNIFDETSLVEELGFNVVETEE
jgi:hypothetical protein